METTSLNKTIKKCKNWLHVYLSVTCCVDIYIVCLLFVGYCLCLCVFFYFIVDSKGEDFKPFQLKFDSHVGPVNIFTLTCIVCLLFIIIIILFYLTSDRKHLQ